MTSPRDPRDPSDPRGAHVDPRPTDAATRIASTAPLRPGLVRCDDCNTANSPTRAFCQRCGARLPRLGAVPPGGGGRVVRRTNAGPLLAAVALAAVVAALAFVLSGGRLPGVLGPGSSPGRSLVAGSPGASRSPVVTSSPGTSSAPPSASGAATRRPSPGAPTPRPRFACTTMRVTDRSTARWTVGSATWDAQGPADILTLNMTRGAPRRQGNSNVTVEVVPIAGLAERNIEVPGDGDVALVVTLRGVRLATPLSASPGLTALRELEFVQRGNRAVGVLGVAGQGCFGVSVPAWTASAAPESGAIVLEIRNR